MVETSDLGDRRRRIRAQSRARVRGGLGQVHRVPVSARDGRNKPAAVEGSRLLNLFPRALVCSGPPCDAGVQVCGGAGGVRLNPPREAI